MWLQDAFIMHCEGWHAVKYANDNIALLLHSYNIIVSWGQPQVNISCNLRQMNFKLRYDFRQWLLHYIVMNAYSKNMQVALLFIQLIYTYILQ